MGRLRQTKTNRKRAALPRPTYDHRKPFVEHLHELRKRALYVIASIFVFSLAAYFVQERIVNFLLRPSHHQQFIYTSPGGGINFLFQVCTYVGITLSIPVILRQVLRFLEPIVTDSTRRLVLRYSIFSALLAFLGIGFGYFIGLPIALHFLSHQFTTTQIHPLFTLQEYMSFVTVYLIGSALFFQIPLVVLFINRIKPLPPRRLLHLERYIIVGAFIVAMIMAPTPNLIDQLIIAGPIIIIYQMSIVLVWRQNRIRKLPRRARILLEQDSIVQAERSKRVAVSGSLTTPG